MWEVVGNVLGGAALAGLRRTGQSARHDAFFMPETLRAEIVTNREAGTYQGDPNDPRMVELQGVQIRQVRDDRSWPLMATDCLC